MILDIASRSKKIILQKKVRAVNFDPSFGLQLSGINNFNLISNALM